MVKLIQFKRSWHIDFRTQCIIMTPRSLNVIKSDVLKSRKTIEIQNSWMAIYLTYILSFVNGNTVLTFTILVKNYKINRQLKPWALVRRERDLLPATGRMYRWTVVNTKEKTIKYQKDSIINLCDWFLKGKFCK